VNPVFVVQSRRRFVSASMILLTFAMAPAMLTAQQPGWPTRPIRLLVAYPPGGVSDTIARALADKLALQLGAAVVVENRAGAGGGIAIETLARSAPDGYTLCFSAASPLVLSPHLGKVNYDPLRDIAPVISVMSTPVLVVGTPALQATHFAAMLAIAKTRPAALRWASSGSGTVGHMVLEQVRAESGVDITHIPYKGGGQQLNDALAGQFELLSTNVGAVQLQHIRAGKLVPLAVGAASRLAVLPEVPTLAELGFPRANLASLFGIFAPGKTPTAIVSRLNIELNKALLHPDIHERLLAVNNLPTGGSAEAFAKVLASQSELNRRLLDAAKGVRR
jgi:tripartite-type tricarboxylate transporter receptor subunit TctC